MSRHMYDIGQILQTPIAERALNDEQLYRQVISDSHFSKGRITFSMTA